MCRRNHANPWWFVLAAMLVLLSTCALHAEEWPSEREVTEQIAEELQAESDVRTWDGCWCDVLTETHAIEVEWATKWKESLGQAAYYADCFQRQPGVIVLVKDAMKESRYVYRLKIAAAQYNVPVWVRVVEPKG